MWDLIDRTVAEYNPACFAGDFLFGACHHVMDAFWTAVVAGDQYAAEKALQRTFEHSVTNVIVAVRISGDASDPALDPPALASRYPFSRTPKGRCCPGGSVDVLLWFDEDAEYAERVNPRLWTDHLFALLWRHYEGRGLQRALRITASGETHQRCSASESDLREVYARVSSDTSYRKEITDAQAAPQPDPE